MGQYYYGVIINKESKQPIMAHDGYKLSESGWTTMIQYGGLHFKGTHTLKELGLADAPDYVLTEVVRFGWAPEHMQYYTGDDPKAVHSEWSQTEFLRAAKDSDRYDVYLCMETGHYYYPAAEKIADVCMESLSENIRYWIKEHEEREVA